MIKCKSCPLISMLPQNAMWRNMHPIHLNVLPAATQQKNGHGHGPEKELITIIKCLN